MKFIITLMLVVLAGCSDLAMKADDTNQGTEQINPDVITNTDPGPCNCNYGLAVISYRVDGSTTKITIKNIGTRNIMGAELTLQMTGLSGDVSTINEDVYVDAGALKEISIYTDGLDYSDQVVGVQVLSLIDSWDSSPNILTPPLYINRIGALPPQPVVPESYLEDILTTGDANSQNSAYGLTVVSAKIDTTYPSSLTVTVKNIGVNKLYNVSLTVQATSSNGLAFISSETVYLALGETKDINIGTYTGKWNSCNGCVLDKVSVVSMSSPSGTPNVSVSPYIPVTNITRY